MAAANVIIGIDCACQPRDIGLARAEWSEDDRPRVTDVLCGNEVTDIAQLIAGWVRDSERCLLAMDAPLGWPESLGRTLNQHNAGAVIETEPNMLFRRETDRDIYRRFRKMPLDVGADRIARTAVAALQLLDRVRGRTGLVIPLSWSPDDKHGVSAIEVYPAGTLLAYGFPASGYKKSEQRTVRTDILGRLSEVLDLPADTNSLLEDADKLDAIVCVMAAFDFMKHRAVPPSDLLVAKNEGWIWVREHNYSSSQIKRNE